MTGTATPAPTRPSPEALDARYFAHPLDVSAHRRIDRVSSSDLAPPKSGRLQSMSQRDGLHTSRMSVLAETDVARVRRWCRGRPLERVCEAV